MGKQLTSDNVWKEYPRPQLQRTDWYTDHPLSTAALKAFKKGSIVIAIRCTNDDDGQFLDTGLIDLVYKK